MTTPETDPLAVGPRIEYEVKVYWPDEGGNETSRGWLSARQLAAKFRSLAEKLDEYDQQVAVDASLAGDTEWDRDHRHICADTARDGNYVAICDLPPGHLKEPHNDQWHQESGGLTWRRHGDRIVEFR